MVKKMKAFNSVFEAIRHIKEHLPEDTYDELYLMYHEDRDRFYVTDNTDDLEKRMDEDFYSWGYDCDDPDEHAAKYSVWSYTNTENKEKWPDLYREFKRTPLSKNYLRGKVTTSGETVASFTVDKY